MIWCVEDDASIRDIELYALKSAGFETRGFENGADCWLALQKEQPELLLLDVMLPGMDGLELLHKIKAQPELKHLPIIMATAKGTEFDKIQSLDLGADDYLVKPFGVLEMISRVKAVLRRYSTSHESTVFCLEGLTLDTREHTVSVDGERVNLTFKEFELLKLFMSHIGTAFTRDQLFNRVWGPDYCADTRTLDIHIRTLRNKIGKYGRYIETIRNLGYRMDKNREN
ncbi:MAG: response regulator transcription factor [Spirochaetia bacterium]|nr:response regulator transcription factor [Spirochaetia bacterium]